MAANYILAAVSVTFLVLAFVRLTRGGTAGHPRTRTWLLIALIFGAMSAWLFYQG